MLGLVGALKSATLILALQLLIMQRLYSDQKLIIELILWTLQPEMLSNWVFRALYKCDPIKLLAEYVEFNEIKGIFIHGAPHRCSECQRTKIDILFSKMPKNAKIVNFLYVSGNTVTFCKQKMVKIPSSYLGRKKSVWWWFPGAPWMNLWVIFLNSV